MDVKRVNILGVSISAINMDIAINTISQWIDNKQSEYICVTPAHSIMDCYYNPELKQIFNSSGLTTPDGMSIVWLLRLYNYPYVNRVYGPDLMLELCRRSTETGWKHFFYGGSRIVVDNLVSSLKNRFPGLRISGTFSPPYRELNREEDRIVIESINSTFPDIVWVGISSPKQELWMAEHLNRLNAPVLIGVGAAFDFISGKKKQAPNWIQRIGLEWLFRFATEPRRLWRRYIKYPLFVILVLEQLIGIKNYKD